MKKNKISTEFIKLIIENDLLFKDFKICNKNKNTLSQPNNILLKNKNFFDLFVFNKMLKQLIRLFFFIIRQKNKKIFLFLQSNILLHLFSEFVLKDLQNINDIKLFMQLPRIASPFCSNLLLLFDNDLFINSSIIKNLFTKNFLLINRIDPVFNKNTFGVYKIDSDLKDLKKICFFFILIRQSLNQKYAQK
jgi:hypothetical protein